MNKFKSVQRTKCLFLSFCIVFMMCFAAQAQLTNTSNKTIEQTSKATDSTPMAIPVLTPIEAEKANNKALDELAWIERKKQFKGFLEYLKVFLLVGIVFLYIVSMSRLTRFEQVLG